MTNLAMTAGTILRTNVGHTEARAWVVLSAAREVDQIVGSEREAKREVRDLKAMGFERAKFAVFASWAEAEAFEDKCRGY